VTALLTLPVGLPLAAAALSIVVGRWRTAQRAVGVSTLTVLLVTSLALLVAVDRDGPRATQGGGWPAPFGITLVADRLTAVMLVVSMVMLLAVLVYAIGQGGEERRHVGFHPVYLALTAGVSMSFLAGDLFNLFVAFEVMLTSSYVLLTLGGRRDQVRSGMTYVVISLVASALFLTALGLTYAATGTVNIADLAVRLGDVPIGVRQMLVLLLLVVFGIKAAVFPLFFWLPDSYPTAPTAITAVFAGLLTKVGIYAIVRTQTALLPADERPQTLLLVIAAATMLIGVLGAIAQNDIKRILSFHIVSQIGYMVMGLALFTVAGVAGAVFYIVHHIVVKTTLFLTGGLVERRTGTAQLGRLGGLVTTAPVVAVLFIVPALSLAGIPPLSGFVAKYALVDAGLAEGRWAVVTVSLLVSLLTLFSMTKIWTGAFWGDPEPAPEGGARLPAAMVASTGALVALSLAVALFAGPLYGLAERAAVDLLDGAAYQQAVLEP
jgi:multicomponent Na+:H+ antiporter subunit D